MSLLNAIPDYTKCSIGKPCTEDPLSVSRQFPLKFHFFSSRLLLLRDRCLVKWPNFTPRGAPHYHVLFWIEGAPVIGRDPPEQVLTWIGDRITCHVRDKESNPELHRLVTRYQIHKCSNYCKHK